MINQKIKNIIIILIIIYLAYLLYIYEYIFEEPHWHEQVRCDGDCSPILFPKYLHLVLFSGFCISLGFTISTEFISFKVDFDSIKNHIKNQVNEIRQMDTVQYELGKLCSFYILCTLSIGLLIIHFLNYENCHAFSGQLYSSKQCDSRLLDPIYQTLLLPKGNIFVFVFHRIIAFVVLWYFVTVITNAKKLYPFAETTVTHSDDGNK